MFLNTGEEKQIKKISIVKYRKKIQLRNTSRCSEHRFEIIWPICTDELYREIKVSEGALEELFVSLRARTSLANPLTTSSLASVIDKQAVVTSSTLSCIVGTRCTNRLCVPQ